VVVGLTNYLSLTILNIDTQQNKIELAKIRLAKLYPLVVVKL
jgi:hypothetical protein